jgi:hypothetical protein
MGQHNPAFMAIMLDLWRQIQKLQSSGGRIYGLDAFGLAACIFAVRITLQKIRHGHHESWSPRLERSGKQFIAKLERERKCLMRRVKQEVGAEIYNRAAREWRLFLRFLRYHHMYSGCSYRRRNGLYRLRRMLLDQFCSWTQDELKTRGEPVPEKFRELIRRHVSYVRHGRTSYVFGQLKNDPVFAATRFANYVVYRRI